MRLQRLRLEFYRNYQKLDISFDGQIHFFVGDNAQGKTNILESIYLLAFTKSHRTNKDRELIYWGCEHARIQSELILYDRPTELEVQIHPLGKKVLINRLEQKKISKYLGQVKVVLFAPEDLQLIKGSPQQRRRFIDRALGQLKPKYVSDLAHYQKVLQQRNQLLKDIYKKPSLLPTLELWDLQLIEYGKEVIKARQQFVNKIQELAEDIHDRITNGQEKLRLTYSANCLADDFQEKLIKYRDRDMATGTTNCGPHRDELDFSINEIDAKIYGSQGQQRTTALSLKLAELQYIQSSTGDYPILLLDDVLSELDQHRQKQLLDSIGQDIQTFVTTTDIIGIEHEIMKRADFFFIHGGNLVKKS
ncbi:DNA replication/repair protein RecF [Desulfuribacillus stibiiarsenatis]|uniref:DNA replication and repair protein RecF n=1 Tax=Desulfuribacillus stibiiarsenatis TaxID=1390249 RepID=A0A1E5L953_9FIRM|nr:DNA replication/repair protein RecF [Desulfuribacillus stibiiarsenatis]OEH86473.1 DNA replication/repair protein RecF [Desulfuribacillus stibiiarsenatis]